MTKMRHRWLTITLPVALSAGAAYGQSVPPPGYTFTKVSAGLTTAQVENITQLAFDPNDPSHVYATRFGYNNAATSSGVLTRYDYSATTGALSNPVDLATNLGTPLGIAFYNRDIYLSTTKNPMHANSTGGLVRLQEDGGGGYNKVEFVNNIPLGEHQIDQIQIRGNSLYVGIGTTTNDGSGGSVYNGTIAKIDDLSKADYSHDGADNLALSAVLADTDPGKLHVFASGFRNPYAVGFDAAGHLIATDNGADTPDLTHDLIYNNIHQGDRGAFPNAANATITPLATLGSDTSADGFAVLANGPDAGKDLVALFNKGSATSDLPGNELVTVDPITGAVTPFITGLGNPLDVTADPFGGVLVTDYGPSYYNNFDPTSGGVYLLRAVPEPSSIALLLTAAGLIVARRARPGGLGA